MLRRGTAVGDDGFTVVELLIVILLLGIVGAVTTTGLVQSTRSSQRAQDRIHAFNELQIGLERATRELRAADPVLTAADDDVTVQIYRDGQCFRHRIHVDAGELRTGSSATCGSSTTISTSSVVRDVQNPDTMPVFRYVTRRGATTTVIAEMAAIEITLVRAIPGQPAVQVSSIVHVRNYT